MINDGVERSGVEYSPGAVTEGNRTGCSALLAHRADAYSTALRFSFPPIAASIPSNEMYHFCFKTEYKTEFRRNIYAEMRAARFFLFLFGAIPLPDG